MEERTKKPSEEDLLSRFSGIDKASTKFLRDIVIRFILAGRDTKSSALTWFFWLLACSRNMEERILEELRDIRARNQKLPEEPYTFGQLREMHYLHAAISEAMRPYPPVAVDGGVCPGDDVFPDGTAVEDGWIITCSTYAMVRMESLRGENCREFRPDRWLETDSTGRLVCRHESPYKFPVFHAGPRLCLGKDMAYIQMKAIVASALERFTIDVQNHNLHVVSRHEDERRATRESEAPFSRSVRLISWEIITKQISTVFKGMISKYISIQSWIGE